jgi:hypothetical protein
VTEAEINITNDLGTPTSLDASFDEYRVYPTIKPPYWARGAAYCLTNSFSITITEFTVQILVSVGLSAPDVYSIATAEFSADPASGDMSGYEGYDKFIFTGCTGQWT